MITWLSYSRPHELAPCETQPFELLRIHWLHNVAICAKLVALFNGVLNGE